MADGVVVGSALVRLVEEGAELARIEEFARSLANGMAKGAVYKG